MQDPHLFTTLAAPKQTPLEQTVHIAMEKRDSDGGEMGKERTSGAAGSEVAARLAPRVVMPPHLAPPKP